MLKVIKEVGRKPVYTPWFSGDLEVKAAHVLGAELFGAPQAVTLKYNDKAEFKAICRKLTIPVIEGETFTFHPADNANYQEMTTFWKFIRTRTSPCSFFELTDRLTPHLYDGSKLNSVFPLNCKELAGSGDFAIMLLAENPEQILQLEDF